MPGTAIKVKVNGNEMLVLKEEDICWPHSFDYITRLNTLSGRQIYISIQLEI
jgi:hypothetical protein